MRGCLAILPKSGNSYPFNEHVLVIFFENPVAKFITVCYNHSKVIVVCR